ncbi:uncharacterized protein PV09_00063 [Verruconis gallopava]|uniref:Uncharacterized protein n=1 Tax=Verruconis gallopava TaxID=253628 RepID=A0A0D1Y251_9PEZI|nr:uncharacterized protein PV09_00063 [Verruconis gallopava]KIW09121.1 hypothetical protein PV09_00063 [Verruconis gallopava]
MSSSSVRNVLSTRQQSDNQNRRNRNSSPAGCAAFLAPLVTSVYTAILLPTPHHSLLRHLRYPSYALLPPSLLWSPFHKATSATSSCTHPPRTQPVHSTQAHRLKRSKHEVEKEIKRK